MRKSTLAVSGVLAVAIVVGSGVGGAYAKSLITGADIKDGTVTGTDIAKGSVYLGNLSGSAKHALEGPKGDKGARGPKGEKGTTGAKGVNGTNGKDALYVGGQWGVVHRNVIGNGDAELGGSTVKPPMGQGALNLRTGSATDKTAFGDETDFRGTKVKDLSAIGYSVFTTGENNSIAANNMPSIAFEIDPNVTGASHFSTLVYAPDNSTPNAWTTINAKDDTGKHWGLTGSYFNATSDRCGINTGRCTFAEVLTVLSANNNGVGDATVFTAEITKGRDFAFSGAVDALVIGDTTYDFEPLGVHAIHS